ncbi:inverted formin-2-like [Physella acuta]|uniref:inverted formin-2-like n=1 Tax=Physella acuta TaxID=109671 RepID=UPI0027DD17E4|nr:inverted formin-2-like [Physella acuta]
MNTISDPNATITSQQMEHYLDDCEPKTCVLYSHSPSVQVYYALRSRLESSSEAWLQEFISLDGLDSLLDSLGHMTGSKFSGFSDAILQIDCLSCIRAVLNSRVGMDTLVNSRDGIYKLLRGFDLANTLPRKHVMELLCAVCVYNKMAHRRLLEALDKYKKMKHLYHRFSFIVNELKMAETIPHKTCVLTLINSVICSATDRLTRCRIRNEFIGLTLLDVLSFLQREDTDEDLYTQLQVFQDKKHEDETTVDPAANLDFNAPQDLADAIQSKVFGGPKMVSFVNILQDLLAIEMQQKSKSEMLWQLLERQTHHLVHCVDDIDTYTLWDTEVTCQVLTSATGKNEVPSICRETPQNTRKHRCQSETEKTLHKQTSSSCVGRESGSSKTSADSGYLGCEDKLSPQGYNTDTSPNDRNLKEITGRINNADNCYGTRKRANSHGVLKTNTRHVSMYDNMSPDKLPPRQSTPSTRRKNSGPNLKHDIKEESKISPVQKIVLNKINTPKLNLIGDKLKNPDPTDQPRTPHGHCNYLNYQRNRIAFPANPMRNLKWIKLDQSDIGLYPHCIWSNVDVSKFKVQPDFQQMEELFRDKSTSDGTDVPLLSNKSRVCLNLFLNRLDEEPTELIKKFACGDGSGLPLHVIKNLMDILPDSNEIKHLKYYNGNLLDLGQAEQFVMHLADLPDYYTLLLGHLRRAEFSVTLPQVSSLLASMMETSRVILNSEGLKEVLVLILRIGNFLNHGQYNGYACGYKIDSLMRLSEVKSRETGHNLVHFLVSLVESSDDQLLNFLSEIPKLEKAASSSPSQIKADFDKMNTHINVFVRHLAAAHPSIRDQFSTFLEEVKTAFRELQSQITELKHLSQRLAEFFCEAESFEIQHCFQTLLEFFKQLRLCRQEVELMKKQKSVAVKHTNMFIQQIRSKHFALKFGLDAGASSSMVEERKPLMDTILTELHRGNFKPTLVPASQPIPPPDVIKNSPAQRKGINSGTTTPDRDLNPMELSHISLLGTPMMNRPSSEAYDEDLTITALTTAPKMVTSSVKNLPDGLTSTAAGVAPPVMSIQGQLTNTASYRSRSHYRSRSDLADSINVTKKWISYNLSHRYQEQIRLDNLPATLAIPESSLMLATLNLEAGAKRYPQSVALVAGPTIELPRSDNANTEQCGFVRNGKKGERKSGALSNFFNKISKKVLKQRNSGDGGTRTDGHAGGQQTGENMKPPLGKAYSAKYSSEDKENVHYQDLHRKNPVRLSNRFKGKSVK